MELIIILVLSTLATTKVTLQTRFGKSYLSTGADTAFFNALVFLTATLLFLADIFIASPQTWFFAFLFGAFTVGFQLLYTKALSIGNVSMTVLMVNLSMLFPTLVSAIVYKEPIGLVKGIGIVLTVIAFLLSTNLKSKKSISGKWFLLASLALLFNGCIGISQKIFAESPYGQEKEAFVSISYLLAFVITSIIILIYQGKKIKITTAKKLPVYIFSVLTGLVLGLFQWLNTYAITIIDGTLLFPSYSGGVIILSTIVGFVLFKDKITKSQGISILIGVIAVVLMNC